MIDEERIQTGFSLNSLKHHLVMFDRVDSTNLQAKKLLHRNAEHGTIVIAEEQTHGRGRLTRSWCSPKGGLYFSVILREITQIESIPLYGFLLACVVHESLKQLTDLHFSLKWPNDVLLGPKKVSGILSEFVTEGANPLGIIVGVGVNLNSRVEEFPAELQDSATTILSATKQESSLEDLLVAIISRLDWWLQSDSGLEKVVQVYKRICSTIGKLVSADFQGRMITGTAVDVAPDGSLIVEDASGKTVHIDFGDVVHIGSD